MRSAGFGTPNEHLARMNATGVFLGVELDKDGETATMQARV
jgi:hypothetical protein